MGGSRGTAGPACRPVAWPRRRPGLPRAAAVASRRRRAARCGPGRQAPARHPDEPGLRVVGLPLGRPLQRCGQQRLLHRVLGGREVAEAAGTTPRGPAAPARAAGPRWGRHLAGVSASRPAGQTSDAGRSSPGGPRSAAGSALHPGPARPSLRRDLDGPLRRLHVDDPVAGQELLLGKGASVTTGADRPSDVTTRASSGPVRPCASTSSPRSASSFPRLRWKSRC